MKSLWKRAFGDTKQYIDYYFANKAPVSCAYTKEQGDDLVSMAFFTPYKIKLYGKECTGCYIVGVATEEKYRKKHYMTALLQKAMQEQKKKGIPLVYLCPETPAVYHSLGFVPVYWRETLYIEENYAAEKTEGMLKSWDSLSESEQNRTVQFVNGMLEKEAFDLYLQRSREYYDGVALELQALLGNVYVLFHTGGEIIAVMNVIYEEKRYQVTEMVVKASCEKQAVDALLAEKETDRLQIDDSYFLSGFSGQGVRREKQKKPYIMYRMLSGETPAVRCYINDIT